MPSTRTGRWRCLMDGWWKSRGLGTRGSGLGARSSSPVRDLWAGALESRTPSPEPRFMLQDLRYGLRILRRNPTFALVAILALALGTGANAAIFQLVNALRLRSLPVENPHELVSIGIDLHGKGRVGRGYPGRSIFTEPLWQEIRSQQQAFSSLIAWGNGGWDLSGGGEAVLAKGFYVSGGFFDALGVHAQIGRLFTEQDDQKGCGSPGVVLSHGFWQARLGGQPGVIGQTIILDRRPFPVIGVTPRGFLEWKSAARSTWHSRCAPRRCCRASRREPASERSGGSTSWHV